MSIDSHISWTDDTWNPFQGCRKVSAACKNCYMFRDKRRYGQDPEDIHRSADTTFSAPLVKVKGGAWKWPDGRDVFTASWSDWGLEEVDAWRPAAWEVIRQRPGLRFFIVTKRIEHLSRNLPDGWPFPNVILLVTVEEAKHLDRVVRLLDVPAIGRGVSAEPLLGSLASGADLLSRLDWIIDGGESGPGARPSHPAWYRELRNIAAAYDVPYHHKQNGEWAVKGIAPQVAIERAEDFGILSPDGKWYEGHTGWNGRAEDLDTGEALMRKVGRIAAGRLLDGREYNDRPRVGR